MPSQIKVALVLKQKTFLAFEKNPNMKVLFNLEEVHLTNGFCIMKNIGSVSSNKLCVWARITRWTKKIIIKGNWLLFARQRDKEKTTDLIFYGRICTHAITK